MHELLQKYLYFFLCFLLSRCSIAVVVVISASFPSSSYKSYMQMNMLVKSNWTYLLNVFCDILTHSLYQLRHSCTGHQCFRCFKSCRDDAMNQLTITSSWIYFSVIRNKIVTVLTNLKIVTKIVVSMAMVLLLSCYWAANPAR